MTQWALVEAYRDSMCTLERAYLKLQRVSVMTARFIKLCCMHAGKLAKPRQCGDLEDIEGTSRGQSCALPQYLASVKTSIRPLHSTAKEQVQPKTFDAFGPTTSCSGSDKTREHRRTSVWQEMQIRTCPHIMMSEEKRFDNIYTEVHEVRLLSA